MTTKVSQVGARTTCSVSGGVKELIHVLPRVFRGIKRIKLPELEELARMGQLGPRHCSTLYLLLEGPMSVGELAGHVELSLASTSNLVAELDHAGLVERQQDPADRRRTIATLVEARRPAIEAWMTGVSAPLTRAFERLSSEERAAFVKAMHFLDEELDAACAEDREGC